MNCHNIWNKSCAELNCALSCDRFSLVETSAEVVEVDLVVDYGIATVYRQFFSGQTGKKFVAFLLVGLLLSIAVPVKVVHAASMHQLAFQGLKSKIEHLLEQGEEVDVRDRFSLTPLHYAVLAGRHSVVEMLLDQGSMVDAADLNENTPLLMAVQRGSIALSVTLIARGADVNLGNIQRDTPLIGASYHGDRGLVMVLLDHGADVNARNGVGLTPLHMAVMGDTPTVIKVLIAHGADVDAQDEDGETPLNKVKNEHVRALLWQLGARVEKKQDGAMDDGK
jgi:ankyrin repeat protein